MQKAIGDDSVLLSSGGGGGAASFKTPCAGWFVKQREAVGHMSWLRAV
jgi:hypothetical protein